jgi:HAMP domain-containing protein
MKLLEIIQQRLSLKVSIILALITIPPMIAAAYFVSAREATRLEQLALQSGKVAAASGAAMYGATLEVGLDNGILKLDDLFAPTYEPITGYDLAEPKFHTRYDFYTDRAVLAFQDKILASSPDFAYAVGGDLNGYTPTHNTRYQQPLTGDRAKDLAGNRAKRKLWTPVHQAAAKNLEPGLIQAYTRDTGEAVWDVSAPIFVRGRHFGAFRVGVSVAAVAGYKHSLLLQLIGVFGFLAIVTVAFIFFMLRRSMRPLEHLAEVANQISTGEGLDKPIKPTTSDEIGHMAKSLNRLRASLAAAMARLGE